MKGGERYNQALDLIQQAINPRTTRDRPMIRLFPWGAPQAFWETHPTLGGGMVEVRQLVLTLPADWLETVGMKGMTIVDHLLIMQAQPTTRLNTPQGCEGAWTVLASQWYAGRHQKTPEGPAPRLAFVVKYGGEFALAQSPIDAMARLLVRFADALTKRERPDGQNQDESGL